MRLDLAVDTRNLETTLDGWEKQQLPFATSVALNRVAQKAKVAIVKEMSRVFRRPIPYTLNSVFIKASTKNNLVAEVSLKNWASKGTPAAKYLLPEIMGGSRSFKRSEMWLQNKGMLPLGEYMAPGLGATLNSYGNMNPGQLVQVLSVLNALPGGALTGKQWNALAKKNGRRNAPEFFVGRPGGGTLPLGVWQRTKTGVKPILIFISSPSYQSRLNFTGVIEQVYTANFQDEFNKALRDALVLDLQAAA